MIQKMEEKSKCKIWPFVDVSAPFERIMRLFQCKESMHLIFKMEQYYAYTNFDIYVSCASMSALNKCMHKGH